MLSALYFLISVLLLILIHEWGHFMAARHVGVGVQVFSIGFGKPIYGYLDTNTGTHWQIAWIPLGGYVKLLGEDASSESKPPKLIQGLTFMQAPLWAKVYILLAGVTVNIVFACFVYIWIASIAPNSPQAIVSEPVANSLSAVAGIQSKDKIITINDNQISEWSDVHTVLLKGNESKQLKFSVLRPFNNTANQVVNIDIDTSSLQTSQTIDLTHDLGLRLYMNGLNVRWVEPKSAAEIADIRVGDTIVKINQSTVDNTDILFNALKQYNQNSVLLNLTIIRGQSQIETFVKPNIDALGSAKLGIQFQPNVISTERTKTLIYVIQKGLSTTYTAITLTLQAFVSFLKDPLKSNQLAGPISIAHSAEQSVDSGMLNALLFIAGLSISVGVLNLLPVPVLDGGQVVYHLVRAALNAIKLARTREILIKSNENQQHQAFGLRFLEAFWMAIGLSFIAMLTVLAFYSDFKKYLLPLFY